MSDTGNVNVGDDGTVYGPAVGVNRGEIHATYITQRPARAPLPPIEPAAALTLLDTMPTDAVPAPAALPTPHRMPQRRNPQFVGRAPDLLALAAAIKPGGVAAITTGIGGVGKTQLAAEFAYRYGQYFAGGVFWLSFADPIGIDGEIAACGGPGALELYSADEGLTQPEQVARVYAVWEQPTPRLLIFDNCDDTAGRSAEQQVAARLPRGGGCRVLVTSRRGQWSAELGVAAHPLGMLPRAESLALLRAHRHDLADADADPIAVELGDLPLALTLAGRYLAAYRAEGFGQPAAYLAALQVQRLDHRSLAGGGAAPGRADGVGAAFALSFARLDPTQPIDALAIAALARAACLAPGEPFPRALLTDALAPGAGAQEDTADALQRLVALGLLEQSGTDTLKIHRLVSAYATAACADAQAQPAVEHALTNMGNALVNDGFPAALSPLLAHLRHALAAAGPREDAAVAALANATARAEEALLNYAAARPLYERALAMREQALGPQHPATATSLNNLAGLYESQGDYAAARPLYERALAMREQALGPQHPATATSLNNLAGLFRAQGDYAAARPLYERALAICMARLGPDHPTTRTVRANLAALDAPAPSAEQQIAAIIAHAEASVAAALANPAIDRGALAQQLEARAQWAEAGEAAGSPYLALAATLRALAARLGRIE